MRTTFLCVVDEDGKHSQPCECNEYAVTEGLKDDGCGSCLAMAVGVADFFKHTDHFLAGGTLFSFFDKSHSISPSGFVAVSTNDTGVGREGSMYDTGFVASRIQTLTWT